MVVLEGQAFIYFSKAATKPPFAIKGKKKTFICMFPFLPGSCQRRGEKGRRKELGRKGESGTLVRRDLV